MADCATLQRSYSDPQAIRTFADSRMGQMGTAGIPLLQKGSLADQVLLIRIDRTGINIWEEKPVVTDERMTYLNSRLWNPFRYASSSAN
jgi:hypothetical protein